MRELFLKQMDNPDDYQFEQVNCYSCGEDDYTFFLKGEEDLTGKEGEFQYVKCKN